MLCSMKRELNARGGDEGFPSSRSGIRWKEDSNLNVFGTKPTQLGLEARSSFLPLRTPHGDWSAGGRSRELLPVLHSKHGRSTCSINGLWLSEGMDT